MPHYKLNGILNHEVGHGFDTIGAYSNSSGFNAAYTSDVASMNKLVKRNLKYYLQTGSVGRQEAFAELFADLMGGGSGADVSINVSRFFPRSTKYINGILGKKVAPVVAKAKVTVPKVVAPKAIRKQFL